MVCAVFCLVSSNIHTNCFLAMQEPLVLLACCAQGRRLGEENCCYRAQR